MSTDPSYYPEPIREKRLNLILQLASYSTVLRIQGETGSGKSTFLHRLIEKAPPNWRTCTITAHPELDKQALYEAIFAAFSITETPHTDPLPRSPCLATLVRELAALRHEHRIPVILIDDADRLPESSLEALDELLVMDGAEADLLSLILTSKPGFETRLAECSLLSFKNRINHVFELPAFSAQDTADYIRLRWPVTEQKAAPPFTKSAISLIHKSSQGIPGRINTLTQKALEKQTRRQKTPKKKNQSQATQAQTIKIHAHKVAPNARMARPWKNAFLAILLLPLIGVWLYQDDINDWLEHPTSPSTSTQKTSMPDTPTQETHPSEDKPANSTQVRRHTINPPGNDNKEAPQEAQPLPEAQDMAANLPALKTHTPPAKKHRLAIAAEKPAHEATGPIKTAPTKTTQSKARHEIGIPQRKAWLLSRPPQHYTLQLMALSPEGARKFVQRYGLQKDIGYYLRAHAASPLVALVYGEYDNRNEAQAAAAKLQKRIKSIKPWIRSFASIQANLKQGPDPG